MLYFIIGRRRRQQQQQRIDLNGIYLYAGKAQNIWEMTLLLLHFNELIYHELFVELDIWCFVLQIITMIMRMTN